MSVPQPPVVILGGNASALSVARPLAARGIQVYAIGVPSHVAASRFVTPILVRPADDEEEAWTEVLLNGAGRRLEGAVLLAAGDVGLSLIARHRDLLAERFLLDESNVAAQLAMLDKRQSYDLAAEAGVPTPRYWHVRGGDDLERVRDELVYPLLVKPILSHEYQARFSGKFRTARSWDEVAAAFAELTGAGLDVMLVEAIEGPDSLLCSYYTYLDRDGEPAFDFTKRIIRRHPVNMGIGCYHVTDWNPDVAALSLRLFRHVGLRGLANAEFKLDRRDGTLKLIEVNARFTAANCLLAAAGLDLAGYVYSRVVGDPHAMPDRYRTGLHLWQPGTDLRALLELRRRGELGVGGWLRSLAHRQTFAFFRWDDPGPAVALALSRLRKGAAMTSAPPRTAVRA